MKNNTSNDMIKDYLHNLELLEKIKKEKIKKERSSLSKFKDINKNICKKLDAMAENLENKESLNSNINQDVNSESIESLKSSVNSESIEKLKNKINDIKDKTNNSNIKNKNGISRDVIEIILVIFKEIIRILYIPYILIILIVITSIFYYSSNDENESFSKIFKKVFNNKLF